MHVDVRFLNSLMRRDNAHFERVVRLLCEAAIFNNRCIIREARARGKPLPLLYHSGVRYRYDEEGKPQSLVDLLQTLESGFGGCFQLCTWRAAELREQKQSAQIRVTVQVTEGERVFHVTIRREKGKIEDPSQLLGMS